MQHTHTAFGVLLLLNFCYTIIVIIVIVITIIYFISLSFSHSLGRSLLALIRICLRLAESRYTVHGPIQCSIGVQNVVYSLIVRELFRV